MTALDLVRLTAVTERTRGSPTIISLIDGPVAMTRPELAGTRIREGPGRLAGKCARSTACQHGTFVAGMLAASHGSAASGICPDCTLLLRPILAETATLSSDATVLRAQVEDYRVRPSCLHAILAPIRLGRGTQFDKR